MENEEKIAINTTIEELMIFVENAEITTSNSINNHYIQYPKGWYTKKYSFKSNDNIIEEDGDYYD